MSWQKEFLHIAPEGKPFNFKAIVFYFFLCVGTIPATYGLLTLFLPDSKNNWELRSNIGDSLGIAGVVLSAFAAVGLITTLYLQAKQLKEQAEELQNIERHRLATEEALSRQAEAQIKQVEVLTANEEALSRQADALNKQVEAIERQIYEAHRPRIQVALVLGNDYAVMLHITNKGIDAAINVKITFERDFFVCVWDGNKPIERADFNVKENWAFSNPIPYFPQDTEIRILLLWSQAIHYFMKEGNQSERTPLTIPIHVQYSYKNEIFQEQVILDLRQFRRTPMPKVPKVRIEAKNIEELLKGLVQNTKHICDAIDNLNSLSESEEE